MLLLVFFIIVAVGFSFLCSIAEAVLLSVPRAFIVSAVKEGKAYGEVLRDLKDDINSPLAVILTLNTIAHTMGAAGAGAQAVAVFGSVYLGVFSAVLTFFILVFSEIIPKALGAHYWRRLAPVTAYSLNFLIKALFPLVALSNKLTQGLASETPLKGFSRKEFTAMIDLGEKEGQLNDHESVVLKNVFLLRDAKVRDAMTPRAVVLSLQQDITVNEALQQQNSTTFSRIPIYSDAESVTGFVLLKDLLLAHHRGEGEQAIVVYRRDLEAILDVFSLLQAFESFISRDAHIMLVVDEYGAMHGIITLEDILESLIGMEIIDESDRVKDMQVLAKKLSFIKRKKLARKKFKE